MKIDGNRFLNVLIEATAAVNSLTNTPSITFQTYLPKTDAPKTEIIIEEHRNPLQNSSPSSLEKRLSTQQKIMKQAIVQQAPKINSVFQSGTSEQEVKKTLPQFTEVLRNKPVQIAMNTLGLSFGLMGAMSEAKKFPPYIFPNPSNALSLYYGWTEKDWGYKEYGGEHSERIGFYSKAQSKSPLKGNPLENNPIFND